MVCAPAHIRSISLRPFSLLLFLQHSKHSHHIHTSNLPAKVYPNENRKSTQSVSLRLSTALVLTLALDFQDHSFNFLLSPLSLSENPSKMNSQSPLSRSKTMLKRAKNWLEPSAPLTFSSLHQESTQLQPSSRLTRSKTTISKTRKSEQLVRPKNQLRSISSQTNCHRLFSENLQDVIPVGGSNQYNGKRETNLKSQEKKGIESLRELSNLRKSFDGLYQEVEIGNRRKSFVFVSDDDEPYYHFQQNSNKIKRKPVSLDLEKENRSTQIKHFTNFSPQPSKPSSIKRIPRKAVPKYLEDVESPPSTSISAFSTFSSSSSEPPKTPELRSSSRASISSIDSFSSSKSSFQNHSEDQVHSNGLLVSSPQPFRPQRSPSRIVKNKNSNPSIKIQTHDDHLTTSSYEKQSSLSPVEPSPMEEVKTPEVEFSRGKDLVRMKKRQGIYF